jgi:putative transposase
VRRVRQAIPEASERRICRLLEVPRSSLREGPAEQRLRRPLDATLVERIAALIKQHPTFGYRKLWALLRFTDGLLVNLKAVYRILKAKRWFCHQREATPRPRVQGRRSIAAWSNTRWAMDLTHIYCGADGWGHLAAIIDCHDREIVGSGVQLAGQGEGGRARPRGGLPLPFRDAQAGRADADDQK